MLYKIPKHLEYSVHKLAIIIKLLSAGATQMCKDIATYVQHYNH